MAMLSSKFINASCGPPLRLDHLFIREGPSARTVLRASEHSQQRNATSDFVDLDKLNTSSLTADERFWWDITAPLVRTLLLHARHDHAQAESQLHFLRDVVVKHMGPRPLPSGLPGWKSFCTDDFTPFEPSVNFDQTKTTVRYSFEPISKDAGSPADPFNQNQVSLAMDAIGKCQPGLGMEIFNHFKNACFLNEQEESTARDLVPDGEHMTQSFLGLDLEGSAVSVKAYFFPILKALATGRTNQSVLFEAVEALPLFRAALKPLIEYLEDLPVTERPRIEMLAVDCVDPRQSRIKIYARTAKTSLRAVEDVYLLGGRIATAENRAALDAVRELWPLVFDTDLGHNDDTDLASSSHRTSGMILNFELRPGQTSPTPKLYLPVRHYAKSDMKIASGLAIYFRRRGWHNNARSYVESLRSAFADRDLDSRSGVHTYISVSWKRNQGVALTTYYNPQTYTGRKDHH